jgi:HEPN domain-containing protein
LHSQQSAEEYIKALSQEWSLVPPRTHDLINLLTLLLPHDASLNTLRSPLKSLTRFAVDFRYPGERSTRRDALTALRHAENIRNAIRGRLALSP